MNKTLCAFTPAIQTPYPPYFNVEQDGDDVIVSVRSEAKIHEGVRICALKPGHGQCTAGGEGCNNYCNMAPQVGPMQDRPERFTHHIVGSTSSIRMPRATFARIIGGAFAC